MTGPFLILNGEFVRESEACVSPVNRGMMYGDGCFETLRSYSGRLLEWELHYNRMSEGLNYLQIDNPLQSNQLKDQVFELLRMNSLLNSDAVIRVQCWREGDRGYHTTSSKLSWMVQVTSLPQISESWNLKTTETRCIPNAALNRRFKLSNGLNYIKAVQEAKSSNADDVLMLNVNDIISETTTANIFWVHDQTVFTPSDDCDLLPGITRKIILEVLTKNGIKVEEGAFSMQHLKQADAVFCCNSVREIMEVKSLDEVEFTLDHPLLMNLMKWFEAYKMESLE